MISSFLRKMREHPRRNQKMNPRALVKIYGDGEDYKTDGS